MKTKAAFINKYEENKIFEAFDKDSCKTLYKTLEFPDKLLTPKDFNSYRDYLSSTEYLFSTWGMPALTENEIKEYFPSLKAVFYAAGSVQEFARPFLNCGIKVFSAWAANAVPVAEYTVAQIILAGKGFFQGLRRQQKGCRDDFYKYSTSFPCNYNIKIGILGAGSIGSIVLDMLKIYHIETLCYDPFASDEKLQRLNTKRASLDEIFTECQTISNHIANLPETQNILNYQLFSKMKKNATFINTGRGAQVVEDDLIRALTEEPNRTALLDVTMPEPPDSDSPLWTMDNVILTPHIAGSMNNEIARMGEVITHEYLLFSNGLKCNYEVTDDMLKTMA